jgi:hypothetical protein
VTTKQTFREVPWESVMGGHRRTTVTSTTTHAELWAFLVLDTPDMGVAPYLVHRRWTDLKDRTAPAREETVLHGWGSSD